MNQDISEKQDSFIQLLHRNVKKFPNKLAVCDENNEITYGQLWEKINQARENLLNKGIKEGDRVAFLQSNSISFVIIHFAIIFNKSISIPLDVGSTISNISKILENSKAKLILIEKKIFKLYENLTGEFGIEDIEKFLKDSEEIKNVNCYENDRFYYDINKTSVILFTSGSTGEPKGVKLSQRNTLITLRNISNFCKYTDSSFEVVTLPISHSFGLGHVYSMLFCGGGVYLQQGLIKIKKILNALKKFKATGFPTTPAGVDLILENYSEIFKLHAVNLQQMVVNSAPLSPEKTKKLAYLMPNVKIYVYYGMTEASRSTFACLTDLGEKFYGTVGKPMESLSIQIDKSNSEIVISGPSVSDGYWPDNDFSKSASGFSEIKSGDKGRFDKNGYLYIIGRIKDQINVGGFKVDPLEVESVIKRYKGIKNVAVFSYLDERGDEKILSFIETDSETITLDELEIFCKKNIEYYKMPSQFILIENIPQGINGKIDRNGLKALYEEIKEEKKLLN
tara:strand:+ start:4513 stop:6036 length:1524 start_codon:yes stop_codon:yes gene_type:complete